LLILNARGSYDDTFRLAINALVGCLQASVAGALSRDLVFHRVKPSTYCLRSLHIAKMQGAHLKIAKDAVPPEQVALCKSGAFGVYTGGGDEGDDDDDQAFPSDDDEDEKPQPPLETNGGDESGMDLDTTMDADNGLDTTIDADNGDDVKDVNTTVNADKGLDGVGGENGDDVQMEEKPNVKQEGVDMGVEGGGEGEKAAVGMPRQGVS
jgi:hypothetical protein